MKYFRAIALFLLFPSFLSSVHAQSTDEQVWAELMLNYPFANSWNVEVASTYSTLVGPNKWRSLDLMITPEYAISQYFDVMAAVYAGKTAQNQTITTTEVREMIGTRIHFTPNRRILTRLLLRLEQRNLLEEGEDTWSSSTRSRIRAETITPLNKKTMFSGEHLWYAILDAEWFIVNDKDIEERFASRFRLRSGFGYRLSYGWRFEFLYTLQESKNTLEDKFNPTDHIFRLRLKVYLNKSKPSTLGGIGN